ncbi:MAG: YfhO family protein, partial [Rhodanobacteraceae bacterium]
LPRARRDELLLKKVVVDNPADIRKRLAALDARQPPSGLPPRISLRKITDVQLHADVSSSRAGVLLVAMPFDRGWKATVDGTAAGLFRADYGLTALLFPSGRHSIDLRYAVRGRIAGKWLSLAALLVLLVTAWAQAILRRRQIRSTK